MEYLGLAWICIWHYIIDYKCQDRETALNKSKKLESLNLHITSLIGGLLFPCWLVFGLKYTAPIGLIMAMFFVIINGIFHGIIDWNIWRGYKKKVYNQIKSKLGEQEEWIIQNACREFETKRDYAEDKRFYDTIGLDNLLHYITLILLYAWFI